MQSITIVFRDNDVKEYNNALRSFEDNGKVLKIRYNLHEEDNIVDYIPLINIKTITVKGE